MENTNTCSEYKKDIKMRLNRIEGQVKGVQRMIDEEKYCMDILTQIAAIRAAVNKVGGIVFEMHSSECIQSITQSKDKEKVMAELINTVQRFLNFVD
jgi:CsoR family transcriptional regulator, copper-sensing transcriptional repressor